MSATEKELVQRTWKELVPVADAVAELFYRKLFDVDPEIMPLFKGDMKEQVRKLTDMITVAVYGLDIMETIIPAVQELAARHAGNEVSARACRQNRNKMVDYFGECECVELRYGGSASASRPFGQGLGTIETLLAWWSRQKGASSPG